jgi:hypothetical protein
MLNFDLGEDRSTPITPLCGNKICFIYKFFHLNWKIKKVSERNLFSKSNSINLIFFVLEKYIYIRRDENSGDNFSCTVTQYYQFDSSS